MKIFFKNILLLCLPAILFVACEKDETKMMMSATSTPATLSASSTSLVLTKANAANTAVTFNVTPADYGVNAVITNTLQLDVKGNTFTKAKEVVLPAKAESQSYTVIDFNALLLSMGLQTGVNTQIEARVKSELSSKIDPVYSNVITLTVNPYPLISFLYVPGAYQGWNPSTADSLISPTSNGIYEGIIKFTTGNLGFKVLTKKAWGTPEYGKGATSGSIAVGGGDLAAPQAGMFKVTVDLNASTITFTPYSWGLIGSATLGGWNTDTDMTYNNGTRVWSVTTTLVPGAIKFRLNDDWGTNFGGSNGVLASGGSDINITTAGTYKIDLNLVTNTYTVTKL